MNSIKDHIDNKYLLDMADEFGTPLFVFDVNTLKNQYELLISKFEKQNIDFKAFYSVKTNPFPPVLKVLFDRQCGAEIVSDFEFDLIKQINPGKKDIIVNGTAKSENLLLKAMRNNVEFICINNLSELIRIKELAEKEKLSCKISLSLTPPLKKNIFEFTINSTNHCGAFNSGNAITNAIEIINQSEYLNLIALNFHIGTNIKSIKPYRLALKYTYNTYKQLYRQGIRVKIIDIGGGFGCTHINTLSLLDMITTYLLNKPRSNKTNYQVNLIDDIANTLADLNKQLEVENIPAPTIYAEPGRWLSASSHVLLLKVQNIESGRENKVFCDGGAMNISPLFLAEKHRVENISSEKNENVKNYDVYGKLPMPFDVVAKGVKLSITKKDDILAVWDTGAYFNSLSNNFGGSRPAFIAINNGKVEYYKQKETVEEFIKSFKEKDD